MHIRRAAHVLYVVLSIFFSSLVASSNYVFQWKFYLLYNYGRSKNLGRENQKLKQELEGVNNEVEKLNKLIHQQSLQSEIERVGDTTASCVTGMRKSVDFLTEDATTKM